MIIQQWLSAEVTEIFAVACRCKIWLFIINTVKLHFFFFITVNPPSFQQMKKITEKFIYLFFFEGIIAKHTYTKPLWWYVIRLDEILGVCLVIRNMFWIIFSLCIVVFIVIIHPHNVFRDVGSGYNFKANM